MTPYHKLRIICSIHSQSKIRTTRRKGILWTANRIRLRFIRLIMTQCHCIKFDSIVCTQMEFNYLSCFNWPCDCYLREINERDQEEENAEFNFGKHGESPQVFKREITTKPLSGKSPVQFLLPALWFKLIPQMIDVRDCFLIPLMKWWNFRFEHNWQAYSSRVLVLFSLDQLHENFVRLRLKLLSNVARLRTTRQSFWKLMPVIRSQMR